MPSCYWPISSFIPSTLWRSCSSTLGPSHFSLSSGLTTFCENMTARTERESWQYEIAFSVSLLVPLLRLGTGDPAHPVKHAREVAWHGQHHGCAAYRRR